MKIVIKTIVIIVVLIMVGVGSWISSAEYTSSQLNKVHTSKTEEKDKYTKDMVALKNYYKESVAILTNAFDAYVNEDSSTIYEETGKLKIVTKQIKEIEDRYPIKME
jgi:flagellar basal body-associated protein FliL